MTGTPRKVVSVLEDVNAKRLAADVDAGRLTVLQAVQISMAMGRIHGLWMDEQGIEDESGIVCDYQQTRNKGNANG